MKGFRDFLNQGNVVQLAVAFVIGGAFGAVVTALVVDIINPIIAIPFGKPNFDTLVLTVNGSNVKYGTFLTAVIAFVLIAAGVYFFFVVPYNRLQARTRSAQPARVEHARLPRVPDDHPQGGSPLLGLHRGGRTAGGVTEQRARGPRRLISTSCRRGRCSAILAVRQDVFVVEQSCVYPTSMLATPRPQTVHLWIEDDDRSRGEHAAAPDDGSIADIASDASRPSPALADAATRVRCSGERSSCQGHRSR